MTVLFSSGTNRTGYTDYHTFINTATVYTPESKTIPKKTLKVTAAGNSTPEDQGLLKLTRKGSTKFYTIVGGIALIFILFQAKVFKKLIK